MNPIAKTALSCALLAALAACGNKGPLVLPERPAVIEEVPASNAPEHDDPTPPAEGVVPASPEEEQADAQAVEAVGSGTVPPHD